jgi:hypothetical protein
VNFKQLDARQQAFPHACGKTDFGARGRKMGGFMYGVPNTVLVFKRLLKTAVITFELLSMATGGWRTQNR